MAKDYTEAAILLDGLRDDVLWLLILVYTHRRKAAFPEISAMDRESFALELIMLESATRDIVARLTALDDKDIGNRSFQTTFSALKREGLDPKNTNRIGEQVKAYRQAVNTLKVEHRNNYIGHVDEFASVTPRILDNPVSFNDCVSRAVNLLDQMTGRQIEYLFHIGSTEVPIDLRKSLSSSQTK
ncbi:hypothetical protein C8J36_12315 [Rhizobium sp. PP-F2F-G48]|uniref:hypothetical protein n=1 Tax=Rhizobium sp. PP-F2F-G48 TaxID=2135651 RepID=UPI001052AFF9|nr:hypothetical protein [Rhizobium sp. PP-F2F-G48]TCM44843.1 hypothetical protein C8J36_12315 [Rhizobium sp. PP-F2F-G48]